MISLVQREFYFSGFSSSKGGDWVIWDSFMRRGNHSSGFSQLQRCNVSPRESRGIIRTSLINPQKRKYAQIVFECIIAVISDDKLTLLTKLRILMQRHGSPIRCNSLMAEPASHQNLCPPFLDWSQSQDVDSFLVRDYVPQRFLWPNDSSLLMECEWK